MRSLNPRLERFCHAFVYYANAAHAARDAGYAPPSSRKQGSNLLKTARIRARIREIQTVLAQDHGRDMDVLIGKLENIYRRAVENHHFYAAARAVELQAKLAGMANTKPPPLIEGEAQETPLLGAGVKKEDKKGQKRTFRDIRTGGGFPPHRATA